MKYRKSRVVKKIEGSAGILLVIIMSALLIGSGIVLILSSTDLSRSVLDKNLSSYKNSAKISCQEESLRILSRDKNFIGSYQFDFAEGYCKATTVENSSNPDYRDITLEVQYENYYTTETITVNITADPIEILK
ncbi:MAG TPA: hypothetical protein ENN64_01210 [bacterium]|nr:hypothetical protein [bacterium]